MTEPRIDVVLPCLDEAGALPSVLAALPAGVRAVVVDNGSTDGSAEIARSYGALVIHEPRRGYGSAVHAGLLAATAEFVVTCDADGSFGVGQLDQVVRPVRDGAADLVMGRRRPVDRRAWPLHARLANRVLSARLRTLTGISIHDLGPIRAARRTALLALNVQDRRSGYPLELFLRAARSGWAIAEVDVDYSPRIGRSKVTGTVGGTIIAVADMNRQLKAVQH